MSVIKLRSLWYGLSALVIAASVVLLVFAGLRLGIDFTGGTLWEIEFMNARPEVEAMRAAIAPLDLGSVSIQPTGEQGMILRFRHVTEEEHQALGAAVRHTGGEFAERRYDTIGPTIGREMARRSLVAIGLVILLIVSYIAFAFRKVSLPVASWKYGIVTVIALLHDVAIPVGFFALAGMFWGYEVDMLAVTAILTILGFSVHDTIVVFDRVRENLSRRPGDEFSLLVARSVRETLVRSINTSLTVVLALGAVWLFGGQSTKMFSITLIIGIIAGTYSSICIASPLLVTWRRWDERRAGRMRAA
ncbi:protein translocase subunit SecF [Candidatus Parcubacteria bacterium]|nr:MAG: protein translocase subunit SecF [Candidatus Parcubacteria bacterium]